MTTNLVHPAELEARLQSRVDQIRTAKAERAAQRESARRRPVRRGARLRRTGALLAAATMALGAATVLGSHGGSTIDLTTTGTQVEHNDALFTQGGLGAGTGNFDPFLTLSPGGNVDTESGYNFCDQNTPPNFCPDNQFDELTGGDRTHELLASAIPINTVDGTDYREFFLDSNDAGSDPFMSIEVIKLFLDDQQNLTDYDPATEEFGNDTGTTATVTWDLDGDGNQTILMNTQGLESGSGVSDMSILVPDSAFPEECFYGSTTCTTYVIFYTEAGGAGVIGNRNYNTTAGFEEWSTELLPVVNVDKDVDIEVTRTFPWDVAKEADGEPDVINLFAGDTATIDWTVTATVGEAVDSDLTVSGEIVILNPTGPGFVIPAIPAVISDVEDVLTLGGVDTAATVECPEDLPFELGAGDTVTCTYTASPSDAEDGTNTATVTIETNEEGAVTEYSDTEVVDFDLATVTEVDECITVTDDNATPGDLTDDLELDDELCAGDSPGIYQFSTDVGPYDIDSCGQVTITNRAETVTNDTETTDSASDDVDVNCYELTVTKDANESLTRTWSWDLAKSADVESIELFAGDSADITWTVTVSSLGSEDSGWAVEGDITISNPAPMIADDVDVADEVSGVGAATVDCSADAGDQSTVDIPAAVLGVPGEATCSYSLALPDGTDRTNTATATLFDVDYTGTAAVDFDANTPVTDVDDCISVSDDNATPGDDTDDFDFVPSEVCLDDLDANGEFTFPTFTTTVGPFSVDDCDSLTVTNTADSVTNDNSVADSASDDVDVTCYELTVTKDASTSLDRDWDWEIVKERVIVNGEDDGDGDPLTLTLAIGQTFTATYEITVNTTGSVDSNWAVDGVITIANPAPMIADDVDVADQVSGVGAATVDCSADAGDQSTVDVPAAVLGVPGEATCSYSLALPDGADRTNTATATLFDIDYTGTADVLFDANTAVTEIDECIDVVDDNGTPADDTDDTALGTVCADDPLPHTFTNTIDIGPFEVCGPAEFTNTASFTTTDDDNDTDESGSDVYTITIDVPCPEGCSLTQGYWKTHNDTFWGGAPSDDTWFLLGDVDGDGTSEGEGETFFLSGGTYFQAMWTAPKGNVYYNLSRQYIAAVLNGLNGAAVPAGVQDAIDDATALFETYTPAQIAALKGKAGNALRAEFIALAGILGSYNEGTFPGGPPHCDEDTTSAAIVLPPLLPARRRRFA